MIGPEKVVYQQETDSEQESPKEGQNDEHQTGKKQGKTSSELGIPVDSFGILKGHQKAVTCCQVDPKGYRLATGGLDYHVRLWDFHGMNKNMTSFRIIQPFAGNLIRNLHYNKTGTHLMVICGGKQVAMLDKDGAKSVFTVKGYMYLKELNKTKGHVNTIHDGQFHPFEANEFATGSGDGTIRLWDLEQKLEGIQKQLGHKICLKCRDSKNYMTGVTGINYTSDAKMVFGGCLDGSLQGFSTKNNFHRPELVVRDAHRPGEQYTSILSYENGLKIVTRNTDDTMKVWDLRKFNKPQVHYSSLLNYFPGSKMCWSPNKSILAVGTSIGEHQDQKESFIHFFDPISFDKIKTISMGKASVNGLTWSPAINQIIAGTSQPEAKIFFDEKISVKGALQCVNKKPRVDKDPTFDYSHPIYLPHSLPIYKQRPTNNIKKDIQEVRRNPVLSAKPYIPIQGPNKGAQEMVAYTPIQHMIQSLNQNIEKVDDARKPLWQIAKQTQKKRPQYTLAYQLTQPTKIYREGDDAPIESPQFELLQKMQKICPHCGLKLCTCTNKDRMDEEDYQEEEDPNKRPYGR